MKISNRILVRITADALVPLAQHTRPDVNEVGQVLAIMGYRVPQDVVTTELELWWNDVEQEMSDPFYQRDVNEVHVRQLAQAAWDLGRQDALRELTAGLEAWIDSFTDALLEGVDELLDLDSRLKAILDQGRDGWVALLEDEKLREHVEALEACLPTKKTG